jgi:hypothetical protein
MKVFILRDQHAPELEGALPHQFICRATNAQRSDVQRSRT